MNINYSKNKNETFFQTVEKIIDATNLQNYIPIYDKYRNGIWILTGDSDTESKIIFANTTCSSLETVFSGSQNTRAVFVLPTKSALIIGGDSPFQKNHIQVLDPHNATSEKILELRAKKKETHAYLYKTMDENQGTKALKAIWPPALHKYLPVDTPVK